MNDAMRKMSEVVEEFNRRSRAAMDGIGKSIEASLNTDIRRMPVDLGSRFRARMSSVKGLDFDAAMASTFSGFKMPEFKPVRVIAVVVEQEGVE